MKVVSGAPRHFNRELSWVAFNERVLGQALDPSVPPLERLKFLAIVGSNFDEFFMVRVAGLKRAAEAEGGSLDPSGLSPREILSAIAERVRAVVAAQYACLMDEILPALARGGLAVMRPADWDKTQNRYLETYFLERVYPLLTPLRADVEIPSTGNLKIHVAFALAREEADGTAEEAFAVVQVPPNLPRFIEIPGDRKERRFALLDDVVDRFGGALFPGWTVTDSGAFKVTRDADLGVDEDRDDDFVAAMEEVLVNRQNSRAVRLAVSGEGGPLSARLRDGLGLTPDDVYPMPGPVDIRTFMELASLPGFDSLRWPAWPPLPSPDFPEGESVFAEITKRDIAVFLPYESFDPVLAFFREAAEDPDVLAVKTTLYRISPSSPIVESLKAAARSGKQVTAVVELKARFDEERNIAWANDLERSGVIVVHGVARHKVHAKVALVVRREANGIRRYVHVATGNYNERTAKLYTDVSLFTASDEAGQDASSFFNTLSGYSAVRDFKRLVMAPFDMKRAVIGMIEREASRSTQDYPGLIMAKMNALADSDVVEALYAASRRGVRISLNVRGVCTLVPGVPGQSETIEVVSIVDRYLEHARLFFFSNGGADELWLGSADWMTRNLERRVEAMFPVTDAEVRRRALDCLSSAFRDDVNARVLGPDGTWSPRAGGTGKFRLQEWMHETARRRHEAAIADPVDGLSVRKRKE